jgi:hypothetical protein
MNFRNNKNFLLFLIHFVADSQKLLKLHLLALAHRSAAYLKLSMFRESLDDCQSWLALLNGDDANSRNSDAPADLASLHVRRACNFLALAFVDVARAELERASRCGLRETTRAALQEEIDRAAQWTERRTSYQVLGVTRQSNAGDIKQRFRRLCLLLHPDKCKQVFNGSVSDQEAQSAFKLLREAFESLRDNRPQLDRSLQHQPDADRPFAFSFLI